MYDTVIVLGIRGVVILVSIRMSLILLQVHRNAACIHDPGNTVPDAFCYNVCNSFTSLQSQVLLLAKNEHHQQCGGDEASVATPDWFWSLH